MLGGTACTAKDDDGGTYGAENEIEEEAEAEDGTVGTLAGVSF